MIWNIIVFSLLVVPILIGFILDWQISLVGIPYSMSVFAIMSVLHFIIQLFIGYLNRRQSVPTSEPPVEKYGIQITGWKEDAALFEQCLISIKNQSCAAEYITFCSDGNESDDEYMVDIFKKVFPDNNIIRLPLDATASMSDHNPSWIDYYLPKLTSKNICITQPHKGKRYAMYSQIKLLLRLSVDYIMFIDSDTIIDADGVSILLNTAKYNKVDAITGDVRIYNRVNLLSILISLKYWYAFNIERAAQAYFHNVCCLSGPFSLYKYDILKLIVNPWIDQTFMGEECTFGDDRHLTNLVLKNGGSTYYTHKAICYTDTPIDLRRFITQQTRWGKSFIREYLLNFNWFNKSQLWLLYDLNFMTVYSLFLTGYIIVIFSRLDFYTNMMFMLAVLGSTLIRSIYAILITHDYAHILFILYSYIYLLFLIPVKIWAILTVNKTQWGTGNRLIKTSKNMDLIPVILWNILLLVSFVGSFAKYIIGCIKHDGLNKGAHKIGSLDSELIILLINIGLTLLPLGYYLINNKKLIRNLLVDNHVI